MSRLLILITLLATSQVTQAMPWYASGDNIRGASLLTPDGRKQHVSRLQGMRSFTECSEYMQGHYIEIDRRAKAANIALPPVRGDTCEVMKTMGRFR